MVLCPSGQELVRKTSHAGSNPAGVSNTIHCGPSSSATTGATPGAASASTLEEGHRAGGPAKAVGGQPFADAASLRGSRVKAVAAASSSRIVPMTKPSWNPLVSATSGAAPRASLVVV